ncbi:hypothetical protein ACTRXD_21435 [Nitrospira sp. T9]|uniref:hypothetical protein n=1 Tax=unclassified Nitrospira TaxID=2652172 RepID=UPI003F9BBE60
MAIESLLWKLVPVGVTTAYGLLLFGIRAAKRHDVTEHRNLMMVACGQVGL